MNYYDKETEFYNAVKNLPLSTKTEFLDTYDQISSEFADYFNRSIKNYEQYQRRLCVEREFTEEELTSFDASMLENKEDAAIMLEDIRDQASFFTETCKESSIPVVFDINENSSDDDIKTVCSAYVKDIYDASLNDSQYIQFQSIFGRKHPERGQEFTDFSSNETEDDEPHL